MKLVISLLVVLYLSTRAAAVGLQGAYERMWLWYAYQLDLTNDPDLRTIGFRCQGFVRDTKTCPGNVWQYCNGTIPARGKEGSCSFRELQAFLAEDGRDSANLKTAAVIPGGSTAEAQKNLTPDIEVTAQRLMDRTTGFYRGVKATFPVWRAVKGATTYNDMVTRVGRIMAERRGVQDESFQAANKIFFDRVVEAAEKVQRERFIQHDVLRLAAARKELPNWLDRSITKIVPTKHADSGLERWGLDVMATITENAADDSPGEIAKVSMKLLAWMIDWYLTVEDANKLTPQRRYLKVKELWAASKNFAQRLSCSNT